MNNHKKNHLKGFLFFLICCAFFVCFMFTFKKRKRENLNSPTEKNDEKKEREPGFTLKKKNDNDAFVCLYMCVCVIFALCETKNSANVL